MMREWLNPFVDMQMERPMAWSNQIVVSNYENGKINFIYIYIYI